MSSVEIEDVLASIRRLVSEDLRPPHARSAGKSPLETDTDAAAPLPSGRLILTPALRVVPGRAAAPEAAADAVSPARMAAALAAATPADASTQPDDPGAEPAPTATVFGFPPRGAWPAPEVVEVDLDQVEEAELVEAPYIDVDDSAAQLSQAWADGAWPDAPAAEMPASAPAPASTAFPEGVIPFPGDFQPEPPRPAPAAPAIDDHLAALAEAAAVAEIHAAETRAAAEAAASATRLKAEAELVGAEDFLIDEDVMRELVRDIIREELQGALGERITRNVRKLVRAELHRMLVSRDLS